MLSDPNALAGVCVLLAGLVTLRAVAVQDDRFPSSQPAGPEMVSTGLVAVDSNLPVHAARIGPEPTRHKPHSARVA
jgi:hypothetical protein